MDTGNFLRIHSRAICFALALIVSSIFILHMASAPLAPIADGGGYATRAFALYGFLHTGQWNHFWSLFHHPHQSICPLHYLFFFALPPSMAGLGSYFALQNITAYLVLALAVFEMADALDRREWAPFLFIFCAVNNVALTDFYAFYIDMPFFAFGLWVIARQMKAWKEGSVRTNVIAGLGLGLLFMIKPANALIFLVTYALSELFHAGFIHYAERPERRSFLRDLSVRWGWMLAGFVPLFVFARICGSEQSILLLIDQNEIQQTITPLASKNLLRLFYFPLCLSAFYHVVLLGGLLAAVFCLGKWIFEERETERPRMFPARLFLPVLLSYFILGEFFSFWVFVKAMRSLLLVLPLFWILIGWWWEKKRVRYEWLLLAALLYGSLAFSQKAFDLFKSKGRLLEDNYQLAASSWSEFPSAWRRGASLSQVICNLVSRNLPPHQIICINSVELRNSLAWQLTNRDLLAGRAPAYEVRNLFDYKGDYYYKSLIGSNLVVLITFFPAQPGKLSWLETAEFIDYASAKWGGLAQIRELPMLQQRLIGYEIHFAHPLDIAEVDRANVSTFGNLKRVEGYGAESIYGHHYSSGEAAALIRAWRKARF